MSAYGDTARTLTRSGITYADLGLVDEAALTSLAADLIEQASETVDLYCGRDFGLHEAVTERYNGNGRERIRLDGYPIISVASVTLGGTPLDSASYEVRPGAGILERIDGGVWSAGRRNIAVVYSYGYATTPPAIARIVEGMVVAALVATKKRVSVGAVSSISMDGYSVSYDRITGNLDLTDEWTQILDRYRVVGSA